MAIRHKNLKMKLTALAVAFAVGMQPIVATAGLQTQMESIFNSMTNTSKPGVYEGVSRGVITGGGLSIHNRIINANIVAFSPPSWKIGCGGIDIFGGSFSFINADQLVQLMRAIAANASGYAFSLAVDFISTTIGLNIKEWLNQIQEWIRKYSNSCEMAKSIVDAGWNSEPWQSFLQDVRNAAAQAGLTQDQSEASRDNNQVLGAQTPEGKRLLGNIVYRAIIEQDAEHWEQRPEGSISSEDVSFAEEMMSLYGTVIVSLKDTNGKTVAANEAASKKEDSNYNVEYKTKLISFKEVFNGGKQNVYKCTGKGNKTDLDTYCTEMEVSKEKFDLPELKFKFMEILLGKDFRNTGEVGGVVAKWHNHKNFGELSTIEQYLVSNLPDEIGASIWLLAKEDPKKAAGFVQGAIPALTVEILSNMVKRFSHAVRDALNATKGGESVKAALAIIDHNDRELQNDADDLRHTYGNTSDILSQFGAYRDWTIYNNRSEASGIYGDEGTFGTGAYKLQVGK